MPAECGDYADDFRHLQPSRDGHPTILGDSKHVRHKPHGWMCISGIVVTMIPQLHIWDFPYVFIIYHINITSIIEYMFIIVFVHTLHCAAPHYIALNMYYIYIYCIHVYCIHVYCIHVYCVYRLLSALDNWDAHPSGVASIARFFAVAVVDRTGSGDGSRSLTDPDGSQLSKMHGFPTRDE